MSSTVEVVAHESTMGTWTSAACSAAGKVEDTSTCACSASLVGPSKTAPSLTTFGGHALGRLRSERACEGFGGGAHCICTPEHG